MIAVTVISNYEQMNGFLIFNKPKWNVLMCVHVMHLVVHTYFTVSYFHQGNILNWESTWPGEGLRSEKKLFMVWHFHN